MREIRSLSCQCNFVLSVQCNLKWDTIRIPKLLLQSTENVDVLWVWLSPKKNASVLLEKFIFQT